MIEESHHYHSSPPQSSVSFRRVTLLRERRYLRGNKIYLHEAKDDLAIEDDCGVLVQSLDSCCHPEEAVDLIRSDDAASGYETMVDN